MNGKYCVIGSSAANFWIKGYRDPNDLDIFVCDSTGVLNFMTAKRIEKHVIPEQILDIFISNSKMGYASLDDLYTLKLSHCFWPIKLDKTINDIVFFSKHGCSVNMPLFKVLKKYWKSIHGDKSFLSLAKSKNDFFDNAVVEIVDHDTLHEWVAKYDEPLYKKCLKKGEEVLLDFKLFEFLDYCDKIHMIREEIMVIGIERIGMHKKLDIPSGLCYYPAFKTVLTRLMKGKFADFIAFNMAEILDYKMTKEYKLVKERLYAN